jgi:DNA repair exonuclease SbcCD ATPase subunit
MPDDKEDTSKGTLISPVPAPTASLAPAEARPTDDGGERSAEGAERGGGENVRRPADVIPSKLSGEPVKEITFDLDALKEGKDLKDVILKPEKKEEKKEETEVEIPEAPTKDKKEEPKKSIPTVLSPNAVKSRDEALEGFDDDVKSILKKTSNDAFNYIVPKLRKLQQLEVEVPTLKKKLEDVSSDKQVIPQTWYEHPEAYTITPQFKELAATKTFVQNIANHWQEQLVKIKSGESWEDLIQQADGQITKVIREKPTTQDEVAVSTYLNRSLAQVSNLDSGIQSFANQFKGMHKQLIDGIDKAQKDFFPDYIGDDKHPSWPVIKQFYTYLSERGLGNNAASPLMSMMYARLLEYQQALTKERENNQKTKAIVSDTAKAGPASGSIASSGKSQKSGEDVILDVANFRM